MYADVLSGIGGRTGVMGELEQTLAHRQRVVGQRREALHQEWETQVG